VNSGDVMGISIVPLTSDGGERSSSEYAFLYSPPENITIWTYSQVSKILIKDKIATGIETVDGRKGNSSSL
jgi:hypothetical protein